MKIKINRYEFEVTDKDWILDNGNCYQCMTLKHDCYNRKLYMSEPQITKMSKNQFNNLLKNGWLVKVYNCNLSQRYPSCKFWRFNVDNLIFYKPI